MARSLPTIDQLLVRLAIVCVVPVTALAVALLVWAYDSQRGEMLDDTISTARALMAGVDEKLHGVELVVQNLQASPALQRGDLPAFRQEALSYVQAVPLRNVVLVDAEGRQLVNTRSDTAVADATGPHPAASQVTNLEGTKVLDGYRTPRQKRLLTGVGGAARVAGEPGFAVIANIEPAVLQQVLLRQKLPYHWIAAVLDSRGVIVARTLDQEKFAGTPARPELVDEIRKSPERAVESTTVDNVQVITAFSRSPSTGWSVVIGIPRGDITAKLEHAIEAFAGGMVLVLLAVVAIARRVAKPISASARALAVSARSIGHLAPLELPAASFAEAEQLGQALLHATASAFDAQMRGDLIHARLDALANSMPDAFVLVDAQDRIVLLNRLAARMFQTEEDEAEQVPLSRFIAQAGTETAEAMSARTRGRPFTLRCVDTLGKDFEVDAQVSMAPGNGSLFHMFVLRARK